MLSSPDQERSERKFKEGAGRSGSPSHTQKDMCLELLQDWQKEAGWFLHELELCPLSLGGVEPGARGMG